MADDFSLGDGAVSVIVGIGGTGGGGSGDLAFSEVAFLVRRGVSFGVDVSTAAFLTDPLLLVFGPFDVDSSAASFRLSREDLRGVGGGVVDRSERVCDRCLERLLGGRSLCSLACDQLRDGR